ncbi:hypothetical protein [Desulfovibrio ferrophilus]|uniref:Additional component of nickel ABC transport system n=1 Tax=Desulfovibrio ferrophilus TaxID=241368 RepID=A0A2Z6AY03_9BACT|nr:hypothetical protein [Desulfovibrio ferrophilus]BBD08026.1 additional component of nickel ABC transport system [Desulfovibrio ferrophilus]
MPVSCHRLFVALLLCAILAIPLPAHAHRSNIFAWAEGDTIHVECAFSGGKPAMGAPIQVLDNATGTLVTEGQTDKEGLCTFAIPTKAREQRMDLKLVLIAGEGHRGEWIITADEYLGEAEADKAATPSSQAIEPTTTASSTIDGAMRTASLDEATLKRIVDEAISKRIAPLNHKLAAMAEPGPKASDIFGGIGYILGLFGIAAYFKSKSSR